MSLTSNIARSLSIAQATRPQCKSSPQAPNVPEPACGLSDGLGDISSGTIKMLELEARDGRDGAADADEVVEECKEEKLVEERDCEEEAKHRTLNKTKHQTLN